MDKFRIHELCLHSQLHVDVHVQCSVSVLGVSGLIFGVVIEIDQD